MIIAQLCAGPPGAGARLVIAVGKGMGTVEVWQGQQLAEQSCLSPAVAGGRLHSFRAAHSTLPVSSVCLRNIASQQRALQLLSSGMDGSIKSWSCSEAQVCDRETGAHLLQHSPASCPPPPASSFVAAKPLASTRMSYQTVVIGHSMHLMDSHQVSASHSSAEMLLYSTHLCRSSKWRQGWASGRLPTTCLCMASPAPAMGSCLLPCLAEQRR